MADSDLIADYTPKNNNRIGSTITVAALRTTLNTFSSSTYSAATLNAMTKRDMLWAVKVNGLTIASSVLV